MSSSLLTPININARLDNSVPKTHKEIVEKLHAAIVQGNFLLAEELSRALMDMKSTADSYICNTTDQDFGPLDMWHFMAGVFIPGKKPGESYSTYRVIPHVDHMDLGDMRSLEVPIPSLDCAIDICDKFNNHIGRGSYAGLFVIEGGRSVPSQKELQESEAKLLSWDQALIREGDRYHDLGRHADISDLHRNAARRRGLQKPWLPENLPQTDNCHLCGTKIQKGVALCPNCKVVFDPIRVARAQFADGRPSTVDQTKAVTPVVEEPDLMSEPEEELVTATVESKPLRQRT